MSGSDDFEFILDEELSDESAVAVLVKTPAGDTVLIWADVELRGRTAILRQFLIEGIGVGANSLGWPLLRRMAFAAMEVFDVVAIHIEETRRLSGAGPGRALTPIRLRRPR